MRDMDQNRAGYNRIGEVRASIRSRPEAPRSSTLRQLPSVGILVDLALTPTSGGQVRFWHNIARAAAAQECGFDLSFHFQNHSESQYRLHEGDDPNAVRITPLSRNVRIIELPPMLSTSRMRFLAEIPDQADLVPYHRQLAKMIAPYDIVHTTDAYFAYANTALRCVDHGRQALVTSIHTDTPAYTRVYSERAFRNLLGARRIERLIVEKWRWPERLEQRMKRSLRRHLGACEHIWFAPVDDPKTAIEFTEHGNFEVLPRGIDWETFSPDRRDRSNLEEELDLDPDDFILTFSGRIDVGKEIMVEAHATQELLDRGRKVKLILAGLGSDATAIRDLLGSNVRLPGFVDQKRLGSILASSDAFVFPSRIETAANALIEARAAGLPVVAAPRIGDMLIRKHGVDGLIVENQTSEAWANAIDTLISDPDYARKMGAMASTVTAQTQPTWQEVLENCLVPGWTRTIPRRLTAG